MSKGQGRGAEQRSLPLEKGVGATGVPAGALAERLTCTPGGSAAGPGPGPQAAGATLATARCGTAAGAAPAENGAAGSGRPGVGPGARRMDGVRVPPECTLALRTQSMWGCTFPRTRLLGRPARLGLTLWERLARLSPKQTRWEAQWAERKLTVALMWVQASCTLGLATVSRWEPQAGSVSSSQLQMTGERRAEFPQAARLPIAGEGRPWKRKTTLTSHRLSTPSPP